MSRSTYLLKMNTLNKIIFGDGVSPTSRDGDDPNAWVNLRDYYQQKIYDLLKFTPTEGYKVKPVDDEDPGTKLLEGALSTIGTMYGANYNIHTGDEYYGVVATREELYSGFLLTYYDKDTDDKVTKAEFPQFDENGAFFENTVMKQYADGTNGDRMVILAYLKDNFNQDFSKLVNDDPELVNNTVYTKYNGSGWEYDPDAAKVYVSNDPSGLKNEFKDLRREYKPHPMQDITYSNFSTGAPTITPESNYGPTYYTFDYVGDSYQYLGGGVLGLDLGEYSHHDGAWSEHVSGEEAYAEAKERLGIIELVNGTNATISENDSVFGNTTLSRWDEYIFTPTSNLSEGWYSYHDAIGSLGVTQGQMHVFYLQAAADSAIGPDGKHIAVWAGQTVRIYVYSQEIKYLSYDQAQFKEVAGATMFDQSDTQFKTFTAHQYLDFAIYGVDWNSWFAKDQSTGLLNRLISKIGTLLEHNTRVEIEYITGNTADPKYDDNNPSKSLGNVGNFTVGSNKTARSYNMAWVLYNQKRATWYYVPTTSTGLSAKLQAAGWSSVTDEPYTLDCDLESGPWNSSSAITFSIEHRQIPEQGLFGIDKVSDALWVALPTDRETVNAP